MATSRRIVNRLIEQGLISSEHSQDAVVELDRELRRRSLRVAMMLAQAASAATYVNHTGVSDLCD